MASENRMRETLESGEEENDHRGIMSEKAIVRSYRDLIVWQKAMDLTCAVYQLTRNFPEEEKFGLISQMRRAAVSIPSNIAEGQARHTSREFIQFISHAEGSLAEVDTQLMLSNRLGFCGARQSGDMLSLIEEIRKMLMSLRRSVDSQRISARLAVRDH